jgi:hypothetical protein
MGNEKIFLHLRKNVLALMAAIADTAGCVFPGASACASRRSSFERISHVSHPFSDRCVLLLCTGSQRDAGLGTDRLVA